MDTENSTLHVEVAYATAGKQLIIPLEVAPEASIREVVESSGILAKFPEIDLANNKVGVFSVQKKLDDKLRDGDRVEIYRELIIDPKQARKNRLAKRQQDKSRT